MLALILTYPVLSCKLASNFSLFTIFIRSGKNVKSLWSSVIFQVVEHQL